MRSTDGIYFLMIVTQFLTMTSVISIGLRVFLLDFRVDAVDFVLLDSQLYPGDLRRLYSLSYLVTILRSEPPSFVDFLLTD